MKKNKNITFIMVFVVFVLWVIVFYKLYKSFFSEGKVVNLNTEVQVSKIKAFANEKFVLLANYKDPFFGNSFTAVQRQNDSGKKTIKPKVEKKPEVVIDWSFISYMGLIRNSESKKYIALVSIHGKEYMVSEGDKLQEVTFLKNYKDSIKISYQNKITHLRKK